MTAVHTLEPMTLPQPEQRVSRRAGAEDALRRLLQLQRAEVLGYGNPDAVDAAIVEWRRTHPRGAWRHDEAQERFARWLIEAALGRSLRLA